MNARRLPPILLVVASLLSTAMPGAHTWAQEPARKVSAKRSLEGTWRLDSIAEAGAPRQFFLIISFAQGGGLAEAKSAFVPSITTPGLGSWKHVSGRTFNYTYRKIIHSASGVPIGIFKGRGTLVVAADGNTIEEHRVYGDQYNNDESIKLFSISARLTGRRLPIEDL